MGVRKVPIKDGWFFHSSAPTFVQHERVMSQLGKVRVNGRLRSQGQEWTRDLKPIVNPLHAPVVLRRELGRVDYESHTEAYDIMQGLAPLRVLRAGKNVMKHPSFTRMPAGCAGPVIRVEGNTRTRFHGGKPRFACGREMYCCFCWEAGRRSRAMVGVGKFMGHDNVWKVSMNLTHAETEEDAALARREIVSKLREKGMEDYWLGLHMTGDNPFEGLKWGVDGLVRMKASPLANPRQFKSKDNLGLDHWMPVGFRHWVKPVKTKNRDIGNLIHAAKYATRCTYEPRRVMAQLYPSGGFARARWFDADGARRGDASFEEICSLTERIDAAWNHTKLSRKRMAQPKAKAQLAGHQLESLEEVLRPGASTFRLYGHLQRVLQGFGKIN